MSSVETAVIVTWGCAHNQKDSQLIEKQLINGGYQLLSQENLDSADLVVLNTCTVKTPTENKIFFFMDELSQNNRNVVVAGCISQVEPDLIRNKYPSFKVLGVNAAAQILPLIGKTNNNGFPLPMVNLKLGKKDNQHDWIDKSIMESTQWNPNLNIIQINEGCLNSCSFCATKFARGHLRSYPKEQIIEAIRKTPTPEVWLTSQDTACWGFDLGDHLGNLITEIDKIDRKFIVRVGMGNPNNLIKVLDEFIEAYRSDKIYKFLHLPVQAGNNEVLKHMKRGYTVEQYEHIVREFRKEFPQITLSTDVITGYPTESVEAFNETITSIEKTRPSITNISRYWERRGTPAAKLEQIPLDERKRRSTILTKLCKKIQYEDNQKWLNWEGEVYYAEVGAKGGIQARNLEYKPIIIDVDTKLVGKWGRIKIVEARSTYFMGEQIS